MPLNLPPPKTSSQSGQSLPTSSGSGSNGPNNSLTGSNNGSSSREEHFVINTNDIASLETTSTTGTPSFSSKLGLPPPKTRSKLAATNQPKKFVLDLPKATRSASELDTEGEHTNGTSGEPAPKKARTAGSGLSALLPEPKKSAIPGLAGLKLPDPKTNGVKSQDVAASKPSIAFIPYTLKSKTKAVEKPVNVTARVEEPAAADAVQTIQDEDEEPDAAVLDFFGLGPSTGANDEDEDEEDEDLASGSAALDFFGLGSPAPMASASNSTASASKSRVNIAPTATSSSALPAAMKISAAPTTAAPDLASNYYATLPVPTKIDPYPGFYQKDDGTWEPRRPDEWEIWTKAQGWAEEVEAEEETAKKEKTYNMPADFSASAADQSIEVRAANLRGTPAQQAAAPSKYSEEEQQRIEQEKNKAKAKKFSHNARSRHQLSTLVADAQMNRAELEDRISHMKANKRTGGQKYGF